MKYLLIGITFIIVSCNNNNSEIVHNIESQAYATPDSSLEKNKEGIPFFYNMMLTEDLSTMFNDSKAIFDSELMNPETNYNNYQLSYEKALNLGVYAVDLGYASVYEQFGFCNKYLQSMMRLSNDLGIPFNFISRVSNNARKLNNSDSLYYYANQVYNQTREYLSANEQEYASVLIVAGGWIEAMYITIKLAEQTASPQIIERIAKQKNSSESLIELLSEEHNNEIVAKYLPKIIAVDTKLEIFAANYGNKSGIIAFKDLKLTVETLRNEITLQK